MTLQFRLARADEYQKVEDLLIESFEPITWHKKLDESFGPLNGLDWRQRWKRRVAEVWKTQIVLAGEADGELIAVSCGTLDPHTRLGFIDLIAVDHRYQGKGYGRDMLRGMLRHFREQGALHANLECLTDNDRGNRLYRAEGFQEVARSIRWFIRLGEPEG
ncbi:MAG: GNAT family N-acetyltransferase [Candidatus Solibacter usitatus]|nr:GNAT family N-acetyltransferase [Candidatus Solibacter usitatus]